MWHFIFETIWGWLGLAGVVVIAAVAVGYLVPSLRLAMLAVAGAALTIFGAYAKGTRDRAKLEARRKEEAVKKAKESYAKIDARPDTPSDVTRRMRKGEF